MSPLGLRNDPYWLLVKEDRFVNSLNQLCFVLSVEEKKVKTLESIITAKTKVKSELSELKDRLHLAKETIQRFRDEVQNLQLGNPNLPQT